MSTLPPLTGEDARRLMESLKDWRQHADAKIAAARSRDGAHPAEEVISSMTQPPQPPPQPNPRPEPGSITRP